MRNIYATARKNPLTEEERREWTESTHAAIAELERLNAEPKPTRQAAELEAEADGTSSPQTPEPRRAAGRVLYRTGRQRKHQRWR